MIDTFPCLMNGNMGPDFTSFTSFGKKKFCKKKFSEYIHSAMVNYFNLYNCSNLISPTTYEGMCDNLVNKERKSNLSVRAIGTEHDDKKK